MWSFKGHHEIIKRFWGPCASRWPASRPSHLDLEAQASLLVCPGCIKSSARFVDDNLRWFWQNQNDDSTMEPWSSTKNTNFWENSPGESVSVGNLGAWMGVLHFPGRRGGVTTGGSFSWEALFLTISSCWEAARQRGISFPSSFLGWLDFTLCGLTYQSFFFLRLWLQHDNTVKELKNGLSGTLLAFLCSSNFFWETAQCCLPVGHTHEDIGDLVATRDGCCN